MARYRRHRDQAAASAWAFLATGSSSINFALATWHIDDRTREVCFALMNGHCQLAPSGPKTCTIADIIVRCVRSFHEFEVRQLPGLVEERLKRTIETEPDPPTP